MVIELLGAVGLPFVKRNKSGVGKPSKAKVRLRWDKPDYILPEPYRLFRK
ncbi:hypothetical protein DSLASN_00670 [Desulfoluna limicola]|uniref:Transposase n=1 Tax=Desulfoluna limicola TaxID=2810562 RepID=A0ABM7PBA7_9BACT|nr:hypothetical protein DSLASN_00670 [Desulfoluna limicola]